MYTRLLREVIDWHRGSLRRVRGVVRVRARARASGGMRLAGRSASRSACQPLGTPTKWSLISEEASAAAAAAAAARCAGRQQATH